MGESLREISHQAAAVRVIFLAKEAYVVAQPDQAIEKRPRLIPPSLQAVDVDQPEAAGEERSLPGRQAVRRAFAVVTQDETVHHQAALDRRHSAAHPRIVGRQEAEDRDLQEACVDLLATIGLDEAVERRIERVAADILVNFRPQAPPTLRPRVIAASKNIMALDGAVEGDPGHDLGVSELPRPA